MSTATFAQAIHFLKLVDDKGKSRERLEVLYASGILSDLLDPKATLDRAAVRVALKLDTAFSPDKFTLEVDYGSNLTDMITRGRYSFVSEDITPARFPLKGAGMGKVSIYAEARLFHFDRDVSSEKAIEAMNAEGFEPALIEHLLSFGEAHPEEQRKYPIVGLCSITGVGVLRLRAPVLDVDVDGRKRELDLSWWNDIWDPRCRFLGVRKPKRR